jgi:hypothetical protein
MSIVRNIIKESLLLEGRLEDVKRKYPGYDKLIDALSKDDPSGNNKYLMWMVKEVIPHMSSFNMRSISVVRAIEYFHENQQSFTKKDINQYESLQELENTIKEVKQKKIEKKGKKDADKVYEDDTWLVVSPKSWEASCVYGAGSKWCVASKQNREYWDKYTRSSDFYYIINSTLEVVIFII